MRKHMKTHGAASKGVPFPQRIEDIEQGPMGQQIYEDIKLMARESSDSGSDDPVGSPTMASSPLNILQSNQSSNSDSGHESNSPEHSMHMANGQQTFINQPMVPENLSYPTGPVFYPNVPSPWDYYGAYWPIDFNNQWNNQNLQNQEHAPSNMPYPVPY